MSTPMKLGTFGAWFNPAYDDVARTRFVAEAEAVGYTAAWLGMGRGAVADLDLVERALAATSTIVVVTAIVNIWTNDAASIARSYHRISAKHGERFLLGVGIGHPESIAAYRSPVDTIEAYLKLRTYVDNLLRHGFTTEDVAGDGSDRLIDALVLHGTPEEIRAGLVRHLNAGANHVSVQVLVGS